MEEKTVKLVEMLELINKNILYNEDKYGLDMFVCRKENMN